MMRREPATDPGRERGVVELFADARRCAWHRPRVGPRTTQNSRPTGRVVRSSSHGSRCSLFRCRNKEDYSDLRVMPTSAEESLQAPTSAVACVGIIAQR